MIFGGGNFATSVFAGGNQITTPPTPEPPVVATILDFYAALLIYQYRTKPKAVQTVRLAANMSVCDGFPFDVANCFDIDTAIGAQLDIIGRIVGVPRTIYTFDLGEVFFNLTDYDGIPDIIYGLGDYDDDPYDPDGALFYDYDLFDAISVKLSDADMRTLVRMKIELNNSPSNFSFIKGFIFKYISADVSVQDNLDMTLTYTIDSSFGTLAQAALFLGMLPVPAGVTPIYVFS